MGSDSTTNECVATKYCYDGACEDAPKSGDGTDAGAGTDADDGADADGFGEEEDGYEEEGSGDEDDEDEAMDDGDNTDAGGDDSTHCTASDTLAIATDCKCASDSTTNECVATKYCY